MLSHFLTPKGVTLVLSGAIYIIVGACIIMLAIFLLYLSSLLWLYLFKNHYAYFNVQGCANEHCTSAADCGRYQQRIKCKGEPVYLGGRLRHLNSYCAYFLNNTQMLSYRTKGVHKC